KHVAYAEARWQKSTNDRKTDLWLLDIDTKKVLRLTFDRCNASSPRWAPDGKTVYFLAQRKRGGEKQPPFDGSNQVWRVGLDGSKIEAATRVAGGVEAFELAPDGKALFYQVNVERHTKDEWQALRQQFRALEYGHGVEKLSQLWRLDLGSWRAAKVVDEGRN